LWGPSLCPRARVRAAARELRAASFIGGARLAELGEGTRRPELR
jgi:hypothetical protein